MKFFAGRKTWHKIAAGIVAILVIAAAVTVILLPRLLDLASYRQQILSLAEQALQRPASYRSAEFAWQPYPTIVCRGITIREKSGDRDFLTVDRLSFNLALLPLLHREIRLRAMVVERPVLLLERDRQGALNVDDLFRGPPSTYQLQLDSIRIQNGLVRFIDHQVTAGEFTTVLEKTDLQLSGLSRGGSTTIDLSSVINGAALTVAGKVRLPAKTEPPAAALFDLTLKLKSFDPWHYWPYYGSRLPFEPGSGKLDGEVAIKGKLDDCTAKGELHAQGLSLAYPAVFRKPLDPAAVNLAFDLARTPDELALKSFALDVDGLQVKGSCTLAELRGKDPRLVARVVTGQLPYAAVNRYIPYGIIPKGTADFIEQHIKGGVYQLNEGKLEGRLSQITNMGSGDNSNALAVRIGVRNGLLDLGPKVPSFRGINGSLEMRGKDFLLQKLTGSFGSSPFTLDGSITGYPLAAPSTYPFTMEISPKAAEVAWLLKQPPETLAISGRSLLRLTGSGTTDAYRINGDWQLTGADYRYREMLHKPAGMANRLQFAAVLGATAAELTGLQYELPPLNVTASASYRYAAAEPLTFSVQTNRFQAGTLLNLLPTLRQYRPSGMLQAAIDGAGNPGTAGRIRLKGAITMADFALQPTPEIQPLTGISGTIDLDESNLTTAGLTGRVGGSDISVKGSAAGWSKPTARLSFAAAKLHPEDFGFRSAGRMAEVKELAGTISLKEQGLTLESLTGQINRTQFKANGSYTAGAASPAKLRIDFPYLKVEELQSLAELSRPGSKTGPQQQITLLAEITAAAGSFRDIPFTRLAAKMGWQNGLLKVQSFNAGLLEGNVAASGQADFAATGGPEYQAHYQLEQIAADRLLAAAGAEPRLSGRLTAEGELAAKGKRRDELLKSARLTASLHLRDGTVVSPATQGNAGGSIPFNSIDTNLSLQGGALSLKDFSAAVFGGTVSGSGKADFSAADGPDYQADFKLDRVAVDQLLRAAGTEPLLSGQLTGAGNVAARGKNGAALLKSIRTTTGLQLQNGLFKAPAAAQGGKSEDIPYRTIETALSLQGQVLTVKELKVAAFGGTLSGSGLADFGAAAGADYRLQYKVDRVAVEQLLKVAAVRLPLRGSLQATGTAAASGRTIKELLASASGSADMLLTDGLLHPSGADGRQKGPGLDLKRVKTQLVFGGKKLEISLLGVETLGGSINVAGKIDYTAPDSPAYQMDCHLDEINAAGFFKAFDLSREITGRLKMNGSLTASGTDITTLQKTLKGTLLLRLEKGSIKRYGLVTKILSILNVSQLIDLRLPDLASVGMPYDSINATYNFADGRITTDNLTLYSPSLNMTMVGSADMLKKDIDLTVGVQPFQTIGRIIGRIPVIGWLLTGGKKRVVVVYLTAKGKWDDPVVTMTPMSTLSDEVLGIFSRALHLPGMMVTEPGKVIMDR